MSPLPDPEAPCVAPSERNFRVPQVTYNGFAELPLYTRVSSFDVGLRLDEPTVGTTDPWPWLPSTQAGEGCEWCRDEGRTGTNSLKISRATEGAAEWLYEWEGDGGFTETWPAGRRFAVSVWAKSEQLTGRGAALALRWGVWNYPERFAYVYSEKLRGTCGWTKLEAELAGPPPTPTAELPGSGAQIRIVLRQEGAGTSWFDDLEVKVLSAVS